MPAPNNYKDVANGYMYKARAHALYKAPRSTIMENIIKTAKKNCPNGPGSFNPKKAQEKVIGNYTSLERVTVAQSIMAEAGNVPACNKYDLPSSVSISLFPLSFRLHFRI